MVFYTNITYIGPITLRTVDLSFRCVAHDPRSTEDEFNRIAENLSSLWAAYGFPGETVGRMVRVTWTDHRGSRLHIEVTVTGIR